MSSSGKKPYFESDHFTGGGSYSLRGHVDFAYEVSRCLGAREGAILVVGYKPSAPEVVVGHSFAFGDIPTLLLTVPSRLTTM